MALANRTNYNRADEQPPDYYDNTNLDFYSKAWDEWNFDPGMEDANAWDIEDGNGPQDPLADLDDDERDAFVRLRRWGKGAVYAAAEELELTDINDIETMDQVSDWLKENYGNLFDDEEEEEEKEPFEVTPYERKDLDLGEYTLPDKLKIRSSNLNIAKSPMKTNQLTIRGQQTNGQK
jgi:hypothetical protein